MQENTNYYDPEFNSGISYLIRMDKLFREIHYSKSISDIPTTFSLLESLYLEILPRIIVKDNKKIEEDEENNEVKKIESMMTDCRNVYNIYRDSKNNIRQVEVTFYKFLKKLSIYHHVLGLSIANKDTTVDVLKSEY